MTQSPPQNALVGILWMIVTGLCFVGVTALVKVLGTRLPAAQTAFIRYAYGIILILPVMKHVLAANLTRMQLGMFGLRGAVHTVGVILWFFAMARIPIADVTAMNYVSPVYVTLAAALFLGEKLAARRMIAVAFALIGALVILRPGFRELNPGHIAMIFCPIAFGASYILAKRATNDLSATVVVAMLTITVSIGLAPLAYSVWISPTLFEVAILAGVAVLATFAHYSMSLAFQAAPVGVTQPATFLQLVWAVMLGSLVFGEAIDPFVILGGAIIVASVSFIAWREAVLKRRQRTPQMAQTL